MCLQCRRLGGHTCTALTTLGTISMSTGSVLSLELYLLHWSSVLSSRHLNRSRWNRRKPEGINQSRQDRFNTLPVLGCRKIQKVFPFQNKEKPYHCLDSSFILWIVADVNYYPFCAYIIHTLFRLMSIRLSITGLDWFSSVHPLSGFENLMKCFQIDFY